jgi:hypothetical protein
MIEGVSTVTAVGLRPVSPIGCVQDLDIGWGTMRLCKGEGRGDEGGDELHLDGEGRWDMRECLLLLADVLKKL